MDHMIAAHRLRHSYGRRPALRGLDLHVRAGEVLALLGPNGAGKTTTVRVLATQVRADSGRATVAGHDVATEPDAVRRRIGLAGQSAAVDERLTARENLTLVGRLGQLRRRDARRRAGELLDAFSLADVADRPLSTCSGGMRRRIDLAAALVAAPDVLFLDEPTTGLDPAARRGLWDLVAALVAEGMTLLLTTQYLEEANSLADRVALVDGGRVVVEGTADELTRVVGDEVLELVWPDPDTARVALPAVTGVPGIAAEADGTSLLVAARELAPVLAHVLGAVDGAVDPPTAVALRRPTLDDVFLALTGAGRADGRTSSRPDPSTRRPTVLAGGAR